VNERIRECWIKAAREDAGETWDSQEQFIERFAELIIEECAAQCWTVSELESKGFVVSECTKRIRKHFGVEQ
jgi:hypothetical protein